MAEITSTIENELEQYALERRRAYHREYRRNHPEKVKQWRRNAILNAARRLMEQEQNGGVI